MHLSTKPHRTASADKAELGSDQAGVHEKSYLGYFTPKTRPLSHFCMSNPDIVDATSASIRSVGVITIGINVIVNIIGI